MKLIQFLLCFLSTLTVFAQSQKDSLNQQNELIIITDPKTTSDTTQIQILRKDENKHKENVVSELFIIGKNAYKKGNNSSKEGYQNLKGQWYGSRNNYTFKGHWSGFHYGFINFTSIPDAWKDLELDWSHSFAMQFNIFKYSINLVPQNNFGLVTGLGFEYQRLRFNDNNISIKKEHGDLIIIHPTKEYSNIGNIKRSSFKNLYLTIPLMMEVQFPANKANRMYVSGGIMGGLRLHSKTKIVYNDEKGDKYKKKEKGNFNMVPFKADAIARIGYKSVNVWGSYTLTNMFKSSDSPSLHVYTVGIGLTF